MQQWSLNDQTNVSATIGGSLVDKLRQQVHCKFCGGKSCRHEDWKKALQVKNTHIAFEGLHSNWVENWAVASQRLATSLIEEYDLIGQFKAANLKAIFNLQEAGEHPFCGPEGMLHPESGFSYVPERDLMPHGIYCYNFPWPDMGTPSNDIVLRTVQLMCDHVSKGEKFLVHCHAGLGRTGLMIACWMMYHSKTNAEETIRRIRFQRPGSIQTAKQQQFVAEFSAYLKRMRKCFFDETSDPQTLTQLLDKQSSYLHGHEARALRYVPKVCHVILTTILDAVDSGTPTSTFTDPLFSLASSSSPSDISPSLQERLTPLQDAVNADDWESIKNADRSLLIPLLATFLCSLKAPVLSEEDLKHLRESTTTTATGDRTRPTSVTSHRYRMTSTLRLSISTVSSGASPVMSPPCGTQSFACSAAVRLSSRRRVLPPLGCNEATTSQDPLFKTTQTIRDIEADDELLGLDEPDKQLGRGDPGRDLLLETAARLRSDSSTAVKERVTKAAYHTTAIVLSLLRLIATDTDTSSHVVASGVALLSIQPVSKIASDPKLVDLFHSATSEWGASYFSNKQTVLSPVSTCKSGVTYESWVAELYDSGGVPRSKEGLATPPTLTLTGPEGGGCGDKNAMCDAELMSISASDSVRSSRQPLSPIPSKASKGLAVLSVGDSESISSPINSPNRLN